MGETINISEYIDVFKRRKKIVIIILTTFISAGIYLTYKHRQSYIPLYSSTVSVRINSAKNSQVVDPNNPEAVIQAGPSISNSSLNQSIAEKYTSLATSKRALIEVIQNLNLEITPEALKGSISVVSQETIPEFIDITVTNKDFQLAQQIAQQVPTAFNNELINVIGMDCIETLYEASEPMPLPRAQDNTLRNFIIISIVLSIFAVLLLECLDNKLITPDDAEKYWGVPLIGTIPYDKEKVKGKNKAQKTSNIEV